MRKLMVPVFLLLSILALHVFSRIDSKESFEESPDVAQDWFYLQRAYPYDSIPWEEVNRARQQAISLRKKFKGVLNGLWREEGPFNIGGRVTSIDAVNDSIIYVGTADGGLFRMVKTSSGYEFIPLTDDLPSLAVGDVTVDPHDPARIYLGLGEVNASGDSYHGDGIYVSNDSGNTWNYLGLREGKYIADIVVNPMNPDIIYACVTGALYGKDTTRGVFRSTDGGNTWEHVLFVSDSTACIDMVLVQNGLDVTIYAAMWERMRGPDFRRFAGPTSGIYRSRDGGNTWEELTSGLPSSAGRIGITAATPDTLYAFYCDNSGYYFDNIYRSIDGGDTWSPTSGQPYFSAPYCWWFGNIHADPSNPNVVYALELDLWRSTDGGSSWSQITAMYDYFNVHVDQHAIWIDPEDSAFIVLGNDGGVYVSTDWGSHFQHQKGLDATQYYRIEFDPYTEKLFGGTQDNGTHRSGNPDWEIIYGGDGFWVRVRRDSPNVVFAEYQYGGLGRSRQWGNPGTFSSIDYDFSSDRTNWNTPYVLNPLNENVMYIGTYRVWKSTNSGDDWSPISGDLTGGSPHTISYLEICRADTSILYAGTTDGRLWKYDGGSWFNLTQPPLPDRYLTSIKAIPTSCDTFFVSYSGYRWNESVSHVYVTYDGGMTFHDIGYGLPDAPVNSLEYYRGVLVAGTDFGVYALLENTWIPVGDNLPMSAVFHLILDENSGRLYAGTHGRGIWSFDLNQIISVSEEASGGISYRNGFLYVPHRFSGRIMEIYTTSGRLVKSMELIPGKIRLHLSAGTYIYRVDNLSGKLLVP